MTFYRLILVASLLHCIFALEAEISQKVKVKNKIYTCSFKINYKGDTCLANSKVSCSPKVRGKKKTAKDVTFALDDGTLIYIEKLRLKGKKAKILGCKALNPDTAKPGDTSDSDYTNQTRIDKQKCLTSPGYPNTYPDNSNTRQALSVPTGESMEITFQDFDVEYGSSRCPFDYVQFYDGNGKAVQKKFCGRSLPGTFTIPTSTASVVFRSDASVRKKGFKFCYKQGTEGCNSAPDTYSYCSSYVWACTHSRYPWFKKACATTCTSCERCGIENTNSKRISGGSAAATGQNNDQISGNLTSANGKRIIGGSETTPNQYPWMVRLPWGCGGALITDRHILTAKHCLCWDEHWTNWSNDCFCRHDDTCSDSMLDKCRYCKLVVAHAPQDDGKWDLSVAQATNYWRGKKVKVAVHNQDHGYKEATIKEVKWPNHPDRHDFAMIILDIPVNLDDKKIGIVCLPSSENEDYKGEKATAMGWGMTSVDSSQSSKLKQVVLDVSQQQSTNYLYTKVGYINGKPQDPCAGDSGGPLVHKNGNGRWTIIGTVYGGGYNCNDGKTNGEQLWNKVTAHLTWIRKTINN